MNLRQMLRMAKWARNPPSAKRVKIVLFAVLISLLLFGFERLFGWPGWLTLENTPRGRISR